MLKKEIILFVFFLYNVCRAIANQEVILYPSDDSYTRHGLYSKRNYCNQKNLIVKGVKNKPDYHRYSFLRFDTSNFPKASFKGTLNLYGICKDRSRCPVHVSKVFHLEIGNWRECSLTAENQPMIDTNRAIGNRIINQAYSWHRFDIVFDVIDIHAKNFEIALADPTGGNSILSFHSKENTNKPYLQIMKYEYPTEAATEASTQTAIKENSRWSTKLPFRSPTSAPLLPTIPPTIPPTISPTISPTLPPTTTPITSIPIVYITSTTTQPSASPPKSLIKSDCVKEFKHLCSNCEYPGYEAINWKSKTLQQCKEKCTIDGYCTAIDWNPTTKKCWINYDMFRPPDPISIKNVESWIYTCSTSAIQENHFHTNETGIVAAIIIFGICCITGCLIALRRIKKERSKEDIKEVQKVTHSKHTEEVVDISKQRTNNIFDPYQEFNTTKNMQAIDPYQIYNSRSANIQTILK